MRLILSILILFISNVSYSSEIVARIDEKVITTIDVDKRANMLAIINPEFKKIPLTHVRSIALDQLINEYVYIKEGKRLKIELDKDEKQRAIDYVEIENQLPKGSFINFVKSRGLDVDHVKNHLETQMLWQKIIFQHIKPKVQVSENEVKKLVTNPESYKFTTVTLIGDNTLENRAKLVEIIENPPKCKVLERVKLKNIEVIKQNEPLVTYRKEFVLALSTQKIGDISSIINVDDKIAIIATCDKSVNITKEEMQQLKNRIGQDKLMALANIQLNKAKRMMLIEKY